MRIKSVLDNKLLIITGAFIITFICVLFEYFNDGVITHHLLAREDLPGISNWWGLLTIPLLSWISITFINKRRHKKIAEEAHKDNDVKIVKGFTAALLFGITVSLLWEFNLESILPYYILLPILIAFFKPVHFPEYLLGFVIGMLLTFGGILPILIGTVLLIICFLIHTIIRVIKRVLFSKKVA